MGAKKVRRKKAKKKERKTKRKTKSKCEMALKAGFDIKGGEKR